MPSYYFRSMLNIDKIQFIDLFNYSVTYNYDNIINRVTALKLIN